METIAVDFDGVIHSYSKGWHDGTIYDEPIPGALAGIQALQEMGYAVFVFTSRGPIEVAAWLVERGVHARAELPGSLRDFWDDPFHVLVTNRKLPAVVYLDDRAVRFEGNWAKALVDIREVG